MTGIVISAFSSLVALGALIVSFLAHRHQVARGVALDVRERALEAREKEAERRERRMQASMIEIRHSSNGSPLHEGWVTHRLEILNPSNQPITDLSATYNGEAVADVSGSLNSGSTRVFPLPPPESGIPAYMVLQYVTVFFTDAAGMRWRRDGAGGLWRGVLMPDSEWRWTDREEPVITPSMANDLPVAHRGGSTHQTAAAETPRQRRALLLWVAALVAVLALLAVLLLS
ncbi:hypothetical protein [Streptomyces sp. CB03238]|uniref:hypothetical protein n=1 Tax=Streptomyces sp. CB03238 TaxID=1907777 RepID=UPI000A0F68E5|nr:hypothetical protein [Streptomyces sp. CB03238]ORT53692.1 hypothetical protein BKD26_37775 [Streptomyces sp. CB03238]